MTYYAKGEAPKWFKDAKKLAVKHWDETYDFERSAIYLFDPNAVRQIKDTAMAQVLPIVEKAFGKTKFRLLDGKPQFDVQWNIHACCSIDIVIEHAEHPYVVEQYPPWYSRIKFECTPRGVGLIRDYLSVDLPINTNFDIITDLLAETGNGLPTHLSVHESLSKEKTFHIVFENGAGVSTGKGGMYSVEENIERKIVGHCDFIDIAEEVAHHPNDPLLIRKVIRHIGELFE